MFYWSSVVSEDIVDSLWKHFGNMRHKGFVHLDYYAAPNA